MRDRLNLTLPVELIGRINELCRSQESTSIRDRRGGGQFVLVAQTTPMREAAFARRLDRLSRQVQRMERDLGRHRRNTWRSMCASGCRSPARATGSLARRRAGQRPRAVLIGSSVETSARIAKGQELSRVPDDAGYQTDAKCPVEPRPTLRPSTIESRLKTCSINQCTSARSAKQMAQHQCRDLFRSTAGIFLSTTFFVHGSCDLLTPQVFRP